ncbi:Solute carrier 49 member 4 [Mactra antiquata]
MVDNDNCDSSNEYILPTSTSVKSYGELRVNSNTEREAIYPVTNGNSYGSIKTNIQTAVYPSRWYILLILCGGTIAQNVIWGTWGPISDSAKFVYGWDTSFIFILTNCANAGGLLPLVFTAYIVQKKGLRVSMLFGTTCLALGAGLRVITMKTPLASILNAIGQFLGGVSGCIFNAVPSQLSEVWFPLTERTTATSIAVMSSTVGGIIAFSLEPNVVSQPGSVFGLSGLIFISTLIYYPSKPKYPPSVSAAEVRLNFKQGLIQVVKYVTLHALSLTLDSFSFAFVDYVANVCCQCLKASSMACNDKGIISLLRQLEMWQVTLACTLPCAVYGNWLGLSYIIFKPTGVSQAEAGWLGFSACVSGAVGGLIIGRIVSSFQQRMKQFILCLYGATLLTIVWLECMINEFIPSSTVMVGVAVALLGVFMNGVFALSYEVACETAYPIHEGVIGTWLTFILNLVSVLFLMIQMIPNVGIEWMTWTMLGTFVFGFIIIATLKAKFKRYYIDISHDRLNEIEQ